MDHGELVAPHLPHHHPYTADSSSKTSRFQRILAQADLAGVSVPQRGSQQGLSRKRTRSSSAHPPLNDKGRFDISLLLSLAATVHAIVTTTATTYDVI